MIPNTRVSLKGKGADLFFGDYAPAEAPPSRAGAGMPPLPVDAGLGDAITSPPEAPIPPATATDVHPDAAREQGTLPASSRPHADTRRGDDTTDRADPIETIRKVVKVPGREVAFTRLTAEEKAELADIVYTYKRHGHKTTENEITRIALTSLVRDYHEHGERSVLAKVLAALRA